MDTKAVTDKLQEVVENPKLKQGIDFNEIMNMEVAGLKVGNILLAIITLIVCLIIKAVIDAAMKKIAEKTGISKDLGAIVKKIVDVILIIFTTLITAGTLGINTATLLVLITAISVVVLMAINAIIANMAGGVEIIVGKVFKIGDFIEIGNVSGKVTNMTIMHTIIEGNDGKQVVVPNKDIASSKLTNNSALPTTKVRISIGVAYGSDVETVKKALIEAALADERVLRDPAPRATLDDFKDSAIQFSLSYWGDNSTARTCKPVINENILRNFDKYGIEIPYNRLDVKVTE